MIGVNIQLCQNKKPNIKNLKQKINQKTRVKDFSKGTGYIKDEHKFPVTQPEEGKKKEINFLNYEEADNLQDMINFAASMNQNADKNQKYTPSRVYITKY